MRVFFVFILWLQIFYCLVFRVNIVWPESSTSNALWFPLCRVFKRCSQAKKYPGPMLCQTDFRFHNHRPCKTVDKHQCFGIQYRPSLQNILQTWSIFFEQTQWGASYQIANCTEWNFVFSSWFIQGCSCVCGWPITNIQNICTEFSSFFP